MDANAENKFVKAVFPMVLGNCYVCYITESFETIEDANASESFGEVMTRDEYSEKETIWNKTAIIPGTIPETETNPETETV